MGGRTTARTSRPRFPLEAALLSELLCWRGAKEIWLQSLLFAFTRLRGRWSRGCWWLWTWPWWCRTSLVLVFYQILTECLSEQCARRHNAAKHSTHPLHHPAPWTRVLVQHNTASIHAPRDRIEPILTMPRDPTPIPTFARGERLRPHRMRTADCGCDAMRCDGMSSTVLHPRLSPSLHSRQQLPTRQSAISSLPHRASSSALEKQN